MKRILLAQILESKRLNTVLRTRCGKLKEILTTFETQIQHEDKIVLKHRNVEQLNFLLKELSDTVMSTTETELTLGMKARDLEYSQHEFKMLQSHFDALNKKYEVLKHDLRTSKSTIKDMQYQQKDNLREMVATRKAKEHMEMKVHGLTEGLNFIQENSEFVDRENKLKNTIFILMRENKQLKNQLDLIARSSQSP